MTKTTLKQTIIEAAEHYEKHAEFERKRMERLSEGSSLWRELRDVYEFNRGRAKAMREALEFIEDFLG